jgi:hypothetical protein
MKTSSEEIRAPSRRHFASAVIAVSVATFLSVIALAALPSTWVRNLSLGGQGIATSNTLDAMRLPRVMLWAWERPEDLRFLAAARQGVAFLARTIELRSLPAPDTRSESAPQAHSFFGEDVAVNKGVLLHPRLQPLAVAKETPLIAVVRIETSNDLWHKPAGQVAGSPAVATATSFYSEAQRKLVATMAASAAQLPGVKALQIDFDASQTEQPFYAALLKDVRARLPEGMPLSVTALASWCIGDPWLDELPPGTIDEAVPMLFRMGPDGAQVASYLRSGRDFRAHACRGSLGLSTDETFSRSFLNGAIGRNSAAWSSRRIYVFSPKSWAERDATTVAAEVAKWHRE